MSVSHHGAVHVFVETDGSWIEQAVLVPAGNDNQRFGSDLDYGQFWYRDPGSLNNVGLSDGISFQICP